MAACPHCGEYSVHRNDLVVLCSCAKSVQQEVETRALRQAWLRANEEAKKSQIIERNHRRKISG